MKYTYSYFENIDNNYLLSYAITAITRELNELFVQHRCFHIPP